MSKGLSVACLIKWLRRDDVYKVDRDLKSKAYVDGDAAIHQKFQSWSLHHFMHDYVHFPRCVERSELWLFEVSFCFSFCRENHLTRWSLALWHAFTHKHTHTHNIQLAPSKRRRWRDRDCKIRMMFASANCWPINHCSVVWGATCTGSNLRLRVDRQKHALDRQAFIAPACQWTVARRATRDAYAHSL